MDLEHQYDNGRCRYPFSKQYELCGEFNSTNTAKYLPGYPQILLDNNDELWNFIQKDVSTPTLDSLAPRLWWMSKQSSAHIWPLHHQAVKLRNIVVSENPELHL